MCSGLGHLSGLQDDDLVGVADGVEPVRDDEDGAALDKPGQGLLYGVFVEGSSAAVASSSSRMGAPLATARAMEIRCRSPPDRVRPPSPMGVSYPSGRSVMKSWAWAVRAAASMSAVVRSVLPRAMLSRTVPWNR